MRTPKGAVAIVVVLAALATGCASDDSNDGEAVDSAIADPTPSTAPSPTTESTVTTTTTPTSSTATTSTTATTTASTQPAVASATAESYKIVAPSVDELGPGVSEFIDATEATRIDQLAAEACSNTAVDQPQSELSLQGLDAYVALASEEQAAISLQDWMAFYGSILGYFCPDNFDPSTLDPGLDDPDYALDRFRAIVGRLGGVSAETEGFALAMDSAALERLRTAACPGPATGSTIGQAGGSGNEAFGMAIIDSYEADLTADERERLTLSGYGELYGAIVGWFCPTYLPG